MDKQIIIDGCNVSKCPHYIHKDGSCSSQDCECIKCIHNVCFYKDYKAKEQECERWKSNFNGKVSAIEELLQQLDQLKATNEDLLSIQYKLADNNKRLRQTLTEIKEIAEETSQAKFRNNACIGCAFLNDKILQKISEVGNGL